MRSRIFIAINLPEDIKQKLADYESKWRELPARWTKKENIHITLAFLGAILDEELLEIIKITREAASRHEPFFINLNKILYGPPKATPRMVWAEGEKSNDLGSLQADLENSLCLDAKGGRKKEYTPHITLARLKEWEFRKIDPEERPEINEEINLSFEVNSIEVMESVLKRGGPEYIILESCQLKS